MYAVADLRVGVRDLRSNLTRYLREAERGNRVLVTSRDVVIAEIGAPSADPPLPPRQFGLLKGKIKIADDFDTWPEDVLDSFER